MIMSELEEIAGEVIGDPVELRPEASAADIPGWDSLNNTLIALAISAKCGFEFSGADMAACKDFSQLLSAINARGRERQVLMPGGVS